MLYLKRNWPILVLLIFSAACKKDKTKAIDHGTAISKIFENGSLLTEFAFDANRKIVRETWYESDGSFDFEVNYVYDPSGYLSIVTNADKQGKAIDQIIYTRNLGHQVLKHEFKSLSGTDSGKITSRVKYEYGMDGLLKAQTWVDLVTDKPYTTREFTRHADGSLKAVSVYYYSPGKTKQSQNDFSIGTDTIPRSLVNFNIYPYDSRVAEMESANSRFQSFSGALVTKEVKITYTDRVYNPEGYLTSQTISRKQTVPSELLELSKMVYQYIKW